LFARLRDVRGAQSGATHPHRQRGCARNLRLNAADLPDYPRHTIRRIAFARIKALSVAPEQPGLIIGQQERHAIQVFSW
jgi:hypothetical protein